MACIRKTEKEVVVMSFFCSRNCNQNWGMIQHDCWVGKKGDFFAVLIVAVVVVAIFVGAVFYLP